MSEESTKDHRAGKDAPAVRPPGRASWSVVVHDRIYLWLDYAYKVAVGRLDNFYTEVVQATGSLLARLGLALLVPLAWSVERPTRKRGRLPLTLLKAAIGLPIVAAVTVLVTIAFLLLGTLASLFGLRNVGEYRLAEQLAAWGMLLVALFGLPCVASEHVLYRVTIVAAYSMGVIGMELLNGQCALISLGHAGFLFLGGYMTTWLCNGQFGYEFPFLVSISLAALVSGLLGVVLGLPSLRVKDHYLAIITLAFSLSVPKILKSRYLSEYSGMREGGLFLNELKVPAILGYMPPYVWKYFLIMIPAGLLFFVAYNIIHYSQIGRAFRALRCDDEVSMIMGIPVVRYKLLAFVLSAMYAGFCGGLLIMINRYVSPDSYGMSNSVDYLVGNIIGGPGGLLGSVLGGAFVAYEQDVATYLASVIPGGRDVAHAFYGVALIVVILFLPQGVAGQLSAWLKSVFSPRLRRGAFQWNPSPDYDYINEHRSLLAPRPEGEGRRDV